MITAIPKRIHYCWFGKSELPKQAIQCIESWKTFCPGYEIMEWNETNFDVDSNLYVKQAYEKKKYAFVTDYVRLWVLYQYGGIYMDTDVEVVKNLDCFLKHPAFSGFESNQAVPTGIMGADKQNRWIKLLLDEYRSLQFIREDGSLDLKTNVERISKITAEHYPLVLNGGYQDLGDVVFYPPDYLCAKDYMTGQVHRTEHTHAIHHFSGSWHTPMEKRYGTIRRKLLNRYTESGNPLYLYVLELLSTSVRMVKSRSVCRKKGFD